MIKTIKQSLSRILILPYITYFCGLLIPFLHNDVSLSNSLMILAACPILLLFLVQVILNNKRVIEKLEDSMPQEARYAERNLKQYPKE